MTKHPITPGIYTHYKGNPYRVIGFCKNATNNANDEIMVVYTALYGEHETYCRTLKEFTEEVEYEGKKVPRFAFEREANPLF